MNEGEGAASPSLNQERQVAEQQRQEFEFLIDSVTDYAIYMLDPEGRVKTWNRGAERIKGYAADEIIGRSFERFYLPEDVASGHPQRELAIAGSTGRYHEEGRRVRKDGTIFWADVTLTAMRDANGQLVGFAKVTRDITERKRNEEKLHAFELLVKSVSDYAIFMLDADGQVQTWNMGAERIKGYTADEIIGRPYNTFFTPEDVAAGRPDMLLRKAREEGHIEDEGWRQRQDGTRFWADAVITAIRDASGTLIGYGKVTRDLTARRRAEQQERELLISLQESDRLKDQFLSILSHELRTPINAIMGFGSVLQDEVAGPLTELQSTYMSKMMSGADVLLNLVNDLLDMSRIQAGKFSLSPGPTDLAAVVAEAMAILMPLAEQKRHAVAADVEDALPIINGDEQRVGQVLLNLVGNAIKFTPAGGRIEVRVRREGELVRCEVTDTGIGIAEADIPRLFQRFGQLDSSNTRVASGTGLGLSISKALVEAHGGQIGVTSTPGVGSTFWFTLPITG